MQLGDNDSLQSDGSNESGFDYEDIADDSKANLDGHQTRERIISMRM